MLSFYSSCFLTAVVASLASATIANILEELFANIEKAAQEDGPLPPDLSVGLSGFPLARTRLPDSLFVVLPTLLASEASPRNRSLVRETRVEAASPLVDTEAASLQASLLHTAEQMGAAVVESGRACLCKFQTPSPYRQGCVW